jgi:hypothetical protein
MDTDPSIRRGEPAPALGYRAVIPGWLLGEIIRL